ncbi:26145_t:CDS:2 [Gigaspora margarita]|uniref:26145_t:CDS:1 n=1 Tax=Gigaspora margarita TaxID=4874 RepID=A0ABM8W219_GIGMA|nr:26145_t:CDS:2 [Gigaspora margarita]
MKDNNSSPSNNKPEQKLQQSYKIVCEPRFYTNKLTSHQQGTAPEVNSPKNRMTTMKSHQQRICRMSKSQKSGKNETKSSQRNHKIHNNEAMKAEITIE